MIDPDHFHESIAAALKMSQKEIDHLIILKQLRQQIEEALSDKASAGFPPTIETEWPNL